MWYLLVVFDNSLILMENDCVCGFIFIGKEGLTVIQNFLVSVILLESKLLKYSSLHLLEFFTFISLFFMIVLVQTCARFIKLIMQFRPCCNFFPKAFCHERVAVISDLFCLYGAKASTVDWNISRNFSNEKSRCEVLF